MNILKHNKEFHLKPSVLAAKYLHTAGEIQNTMCVFRQV